MPSCVVKACKNYMSKVKKLQGITYHAFPRNAVRKDEWVQFIRNSRGDENWTPSSASTVCSTHFDDADFKTTAKGLRCLRPHAIPKKLVPEIEIQTTSSSLPEIQQVPIKEEVVTEYCRLCATSDFDGNLISLESDDDMKNLVEKMAKRLNANIDFNQEHLPTTVCSACVKALYTAYDFIVGIDMAQVTLNNILMQRCVNQNMSDSGNPDCNLDLPSASLQQIPKNEGAAAYNFEQLPLHVPNTISPLPEVPSDNDGEESDFGQPLPSATVILTEVSPDIGPGTSKPEQLRLLESSSDNSASLDTYRKRRLIDDLYRKIQIIRGQKESLKRLNQKVRQLKNHNESLKDIIVKKTLEKKNDAD